MRGRWSRVQGSGGEGGDYDGGDWDEEWDDIDMGGIDLSTYDCDDLEAATDLLVDFFCSGILSGMIAGDSYVG